jgi:hypothetical protein
VCAALHNSRGGRAVLQNGEVLHVPTARSSVSSAVPPVTLARAIRICVANLQQNQRVCGTNKRYDNARTKSRTQSHNHTQSSEQNRHLVCIQKDDGGRRTHGYGCRLECWGRKPPHNSSLLTIHISNCHISQSINYYSSPTTHFSASAADPNAILQFCARSS